MSRATLAPRPAARSTILLAYPTPPPENDLDFDEYGMNTPELVPPEEAQIRITDRAAEVRRVHSQRSDTFDAVINFVSNCE